VFLVCDIWAGISDLRRMEWLVNCDIESDIAFPQRCPNCGVREHETEEN